VTALVVEDEIRIVRDKMLLVTIWEGWVLQDYFTISQVAERLHKSEQSVVRWIRDGKLPYIQISERRRVIAEADLRDFVNSRRIATPKKLIEKPIAYVVDSATRSLITEYDQAEVDVRNLRKEISRLCQSN
jgi:excisionase family DNA binding protein